MALRQALCALQKGNRRGDVAALMATRHTPEGNASFNVVLQTSAQAWSDMREGSDATIVWDLEILIEAAINALSTIKKYAKKTHTRQTPPFKFFVEATSTIPQIVDDYHLRLAPPSISSGPSSSSQGPGLACALQPIM